MSQKIEAIFICDQCPKTYNRKQNLERHKQIHLNKLYSCENCKKTFTSKFNLKRHIERHQQIITYACQFCDSQFRQIRSLKNHERKHYSKSLESKQRSKFQNKIKPFIALQQKNQQNNIADDQNQEESQTSCFQNIDYRIEICEICLNDNIFCMHTK